MTTKRKPFFTLKNNALFALLLGFGYYFALTEQIVIYTGAMGLVVNMMVYMAALITTGFALALTTFYSFLPFQRHLFRVEKN